ncbi:2671_t:CDS:2 [Ambispora gerdemannii]|uniref:2671_t:CDS:1 n=1 Tax=Ambispora gerdemannii TaxID=144530 RepID=A0A9N9FDF7_9GLOM|nr:2671_t:CDS:2 [Ambispora gerdemannii]
MDKEFEIDISDIVSITTISEHEYKETFSTLDELDVAATVDNSTSVESILCERPQVLFY